MSTKKKARPVACPPITEEEIGKIADALARQRPDFRVCEIKVLDPHLQERAAAIAKQINPANAPRHFGTVLLGIREPQQIAMLSQKYWGSKGVDLGVTFMESTSAAVKAKILAFANKWGTYGNVRFRESAAGQIRLTLAGSGYWSYLGTDILSIPAGQPTMCLQGFSLSTPDSEYDRVVPHEFGHAMGFPHEHERSEILSLLDVEKVVAYFAANYGWDRRTVMQQVFDPLDPASIRATAPDARSVMCYPFPAALTKAGQPIPGGDSIDQLDGQFCATVYPKGADGGGGGDGGDGGTAGALTERVHFSISVGKLQVSGWANPDGTVAGSDNKLKP